MASLSDRAATPAHPPYEARLPNRHAHVEVALVVLRYTVACAMLQRRTESSDRCCQGSSRQRRQLLGSTGRLDISAARLATVPASVGARRHWPSDQTSETRLRQLVQLRTVPASRALRTACEPIRPWSPAEVSLRRLLRPEWWLAPAAHRNCTAD